MTLPAPTALTPTARYIPAGVTRYLWVPTIDDISAPTLAEISAGTDLTAEVAEATGFSTESDQVETPDYGSRVKAKIPGMITLADSTLKLYTSKTATDARTLLTQDLAGFVVICPAGIATSGKMNIFPATVASSTIDQVAPGDVATMTVGISVTGQPELNVAIPTA